MVGWDTDSCQWYQRSRNLTFSLFPRLSWSEEVRKRLRFSLSPHSDSPGSPLSGSPKSLGRLYRPVERSGPRPPLPRPSPTLPVAQRESTTPSRYFISSGDDRLSNCDQRSGSGARNRLNSHYRTNHLKRKISLGGFSLHDVSRLSRVRKHVTTGPEPTYTNLNQ